MTDSLLASAPQGDIGREPETGNSKKPEPISVSTGPKLASPFPSPTGAKRPASLKMTQPTGTTEDKKISETQNIPTGADGTRDSRENIRASSAQQESPRERPSLSSRLPNRSTAEDKPPSLKRHQQQSSISGQSPPSRAPSVQFQNADNDVSELPPSQPQSRPASVYGDDSEQTRGRQSFMNKIKSLAASPPFGSHSRSASGPNIGEFRVPPN